MGFLSKIFGGGPPKPGEPLPVTDETFEAEVLMSEIPVVVDFWASWCSPCKVMGGLLRDLGPDYEGKIKFRKMDTQANQEIPARYRIMSIPTLIIFRNGRPVDQITGLVTLNSLRKKFDKLV